jgi:2-methylisocitrate lyase-like PEP mutase family enzyme
LRELGFRLVICPISTLLAATEAMRAVLGRIAQDGTPVNAVQDLPGLTDFAELVGLPEVEEIGEKYGNG